MKNPKKTIKLSNRQQVLKDYISREEKRIQSKKKNEKTINENSMVNVWSKIEELKKRLFEKRMNK